MEKKIRIALAQINSTVGDLKGNEAKIIDAITMAKKVAADVIAVPELAVTGYPPEDLLLKPRFIADNLNCINRLAEHSSNITVIIGFADQQQQLFNAAALLHHGKWLSTYHKIELPNYEVFDEKRYFAPGANGYVFEINHVRFGINICEDIWIKNSITEDLVYSGAADLIINISSSPYHQNKVTEREEILTNQAKCNKVNICYVNLVGGQDELVFDGHSLIIDEQGKVIVRGKQFAGDLIVHDLDVTNLSATRTSDQHFQKRKLNHNVKYPVKEMKLPAPKTIFEMKPDISYSSHSKLAMLEEIFQALVLGTRDYVLKNGFTSVVLGLSGGIDSALTAVIAIEALGSKSVIGVSMPSQFSSEESWIDAAQLANNLGIRHITIPIQQTFESYKMMLSDVFQNLPEDTTEENIQARIRGNILMALSNKFGWLPLTTGNKSEISVGYCTLYGDMAGGFAVIKDVPKTLVYKLSYYVNSKTGKETIPTSTLTKAPTAELRPNQKDEDSLPPYDLLDPILSLYVEKDCDLSTITSMGYDVNIVRKVIHLVDSSEYKRRQGPPGVKITPKAFGKDRRVPITNRYRG